MCGVLLIALNAKGPAGRLTRQGLRLRSEEKEIGVL